MLARLEPLLPPARPEPDWNALAFRWQRQGMAGWLEAVAEPHAPELERLTHIDAQRAQLLRNTANSSGPAGQQCAAHRRARHR